MNDGIASQIDFSTPRLQYGDGAFGIGHLEGNVIESYAR